MSYAATRRALSGRASNGSGTVDDPHGRHKQDRYSFREASLESWRAVVESFGSTRLWQDPVRISEVLTHIATTALANHVHFPDGGGLDLSRATCNTERGCIRLDFQHGSSRVVCRPAVLRLETFDGDPLGEWSYFRLDLAELEPTGLESAFQDIKEQLTELGPGKYGPHSLYFREDDDEDGEQVPSRSHWQPVTRYLSGAFLIVPKASSYNAIPTMYDGRHSRVAAMEFRNDIAETVAALRAHDLYGIDPSTGAKHWPRTNG